MKTILSDSDIASCLKRISHEIIESYKSIDNILLLGIGKRGGVLSSRIAKNITDSAISLKSEDICGYIDPTLYRDDINRDYLKIPYGSNIPFDGVEGKDIVLIDDILFSGRTASAALDALKQYGRPRCVKLAVLIDRGHRQIPLRADFVGKNIPSSLDNKFKTYLVDIDGFDRVDII